MKTGLVDYELLETLLHYSIPRIDTKPIAKRLINRFGSIGGILNAEISDLLQVPGIGEAAAVHLKIIAELNHIRNWENLIEKPIFQDFAELEHYLITMLRNRPFEEFHVLYINKNNQIVLDETHTVGDMNTAPVFPQKILQSMFNLNACAVILSHNHPLETPKFSNEDMFITEQVKEVLNRNQFRLIDHLLVAGTKVVSAKNEYLLQ
ncbi:hypothetical protein FACS18945_3300 [Bacteroidia bacterium]|nr:hypothetical protein FACS18945_3300 [Bacteroidia bacterium]